MANKIEMPTIGHVKFSNELKNKCECGITHTMSMVSNVKKTILLSMCGKCRTLFLSDIAFETKEGIKTLQSQLRVLKDLLARTDKKGQVWETVKDKNRATKLKVSMKDFYTK